MTTAVCTIATPAFLHHALNLVRSIHAHWSEALPVWIALVGARDVELPPLSLPANVTLLAAETLDVPDLGWLAAKYSPTELCCAIKPYLVTRLLQVGVDRVVYADADLHFFAAPASLLRLSERASFTVTPHTLSPILDGDAWARPSLGDLQASGMMNAGLFVVRNTAEARRFLATWSGMVGAPGAFVDDLGPQHEQNSFNWLLAFSDDAAVCRDPTVNVAYWNLHERPLRWAALDGGASDQWLLDGAPIACFHFSGFTAGGARLSHHDQRHRLDLDVNLHALCAFYARRLEECGAPRFVGLPYAYGEIEGQPIDRLLRDALKRFERCSPRRSRIEAWSRDLSPVLSELASSLGVHRLLPDVLDDLVQKRADLHAMSDATFPQALLQWATEWFHREYGSAFLLERYLPFAYDRGALDRLAAEVAAWLPDRTAEAARVRVRDDRVGLIAELEAAGARALATTLRQARYRFAAYEPCLCLRLIHQARPDLVAAFPDPMGDDLERYREWLRARLAHEYEVPATVSRFAEQFDPASSLALVIGTLRRETARYRRFLGEGLSPGLLADLVPLAPRGVGFGPTDLSVADWWTRGADARRTTAPGEGAAGRRRTLAGWLARPQRAAAPAGRRLTSVERWHHDFAAVAGDGAPPSVPGGLNVFGYFRSPIGLGSSTRGLCRSLSRAGFALREVVLTNETMDADFTLADLTPDAGPWYARNLVVSYPHERTPVFDVFPPALFAARENIGHFAWEQRDVHPRWADELRRFDRLLAVSSFSAEALSRACGRPVGVAPNVVEIDEAAARRYDRAAFDLPADAFVAGVMFDAASSIERKNPQAAVTALARAFRGCRDVVVVLKVSNGERPAFAGEVARLVRQLEDAGVAVRCVTGAIPSAQVHGLVAAFDLCLSLHRSEGFGYALAEAMWLGVPAVATRYSGNLDFMNDRNAWLVRCTETVVRRPEGPFSRGTVWAEPDVDDAAAQCRAIYDDRDAARRRAERGRADVRRALSADAVARRLESLLA